MTCAQIPIIIVYCLDNYRDSPIRAEKDHRHTGTLGASSSNINHDFLHHHYFENDERVFNSNSQLGKQHVPSNNNIDNNNSIKSSASSSSVVMTDECRDFMIIAAVLGCLLITASVMMCILSHRLFKLTRRYKIQKLEDVVAEHRRKFGSTGGGGSSALSNSGGVLRFPHWSRQTGRVSSSSHQMRQS